MQDIVTRLLSGDRRALARMVTLIENEVPQARQYLAELYPHTGQAHVIGITGAPGAGKSSLVTGLVRELRIRQRKVAVIAVDPSSPFTGGAILGDRIRMLELAGDPNVFIRSMASRGNLGGLSSATRDVVHAMDAAGYDPIIIETVGTGQAEVEIMRAAHSVLVVVAPGMGDDIQAIKAGILEIADIFVVSKADKPEADQAVAGLAMLLSLATDKRTWATPILKTSALKKQGLVALADALEQHKSYLTESSMFTQRVYQQIQSELFAILVHELEKIFTREISQSQFQSQSLIGSIMQHQRDPYSVASEMQARIFKSSSNFNFNFNFNPTSFNPASEYRD